MSVRVPWVASLTVLGEGGELKDWMLEQPVRTKGCFKYLVSPKEVLLRAKLLS